ncbi:MAG: pilus assembly PilX family protein [Stenotrophomonas rhizophila]|uniref:pilus assembly PilX family protein n=1 Tax=Stenotrophomonas rhizophila TaxID=216778 RepID=UPI003D14D8A0
MATKNAPSLSSRRHQQGAVLYVALIMLILLALLGIAGMQVAGMQEKMASNYRAVNRSFQNTEGVVRTAEATAVAVFNRTAAPAGALFTESAITLDCNAFDAVEWAEQRSTSAAPAVNVRRIDSCGGDVSGNSNAQGRTNDTPTATYQITGFSADTPASPTSASVVDTIFKL